ncbi:hypothetical protein VNI00_008598 [Paramarasmius palmivorus]|uniref:Zn(2)-C6 fungal-type domain-containing protein n=1 Tax=Paramarasmius palmivorus TaxID=297713 RepID=A0AAW0CY88_9AGAR
MNSQSKKRFVRSHPKSRLGCSTCKQRRVKCDEVHPICGNCERRQTECTWPDKTPSSPSPSQSTPTDQPEWQYQWLVPSPSTTTIASSLVPLDTSSLKLMHHYSLVTSTTLNLDPSVLFTHQFVIPNIAFREQAVMHALLALSSIHLHTLYQPLGLADQDYLSLAQRHKNQALTLDIAQIPIANNNIPSSADTHLLTRNFLMIYKLAESLAATDTRPAMFSLIETMRHALRNQDYFFRDEQLKPLNWPFLGVSIVPTEAEEDVWLAEGASTPSRRFPGFLKQLHLPTSSYPDSDEVLDPEISDTYKDAISKLRDSWYMCQRPGVELAGTVSWIIRMTDRFRELLVVERRQRALVVLYFYCVMLSQLDPQQCWWAGKEKDYRAWIGTMLDAEWMECIVSEGL